MSNVRADLDAITTQTRGIGPVSIATDTTTSSSAIDLTAKPGWGVMVIYAVGTRTDGTFTPSLTQADTSGGSYGALAAFSGSEAAISAANTVKVASYRPTKPFIKVNIASTGTTSGALCTAFVVLVPPAVG